MASCAATTARTKKKKKKKKLIVKCTFWHVRLPKTDQPAHPRSLISLCPLNQKKKKKKKTNLNMFLDQVDLNALFMPFARTRAEFSLKNSHIHFLQLLLGYVSVENVIRIAKF